MTFPDNLLQADNQATLWLNQANPAWLDPVWGVFSHVKIWFPLYFFIVGWIVWKLGWKKGLVITASLILCVLLTDQLANLVKSAVERLRPCHDAWMLEQGLRLPKGLTGGLYGFFSGHSCNCFGFAAASSAGLLLNGGKGKASMAYAWGIGLWAALVAVSRVMLGAHFVGDILVGTAVGVAIGLAMAYLAHAVIVKARL